MLKQAAESDSTNFGTAGANLALNGRRRQIEPGGWADPDGEMKDAHARQPATLCSSVARVSGAASTAMISAAGKRSACYVVGPSSPDSRPIGANVGFASMLLRWWPTVAHARCASAASASPRGSSR